MSKYILIKKLRKACLIKLKTGWEFGAPAGYGNAVNALYAHLKAIYDRTYVEESPTAPRVHLTLEYSSSGWAHITEQSNYGHTALLVNMESISGLVQGVLGNASN